jgi:hypothetical protein
VRCLNEAVVADYVRYCGEAVRLADRTDDLSLRCGMRSYLTYGHLYRGQLPDVVCVADEVIALVADDPDCGAEAVGFSPLLAARSARLLAIGCQRDPAAALREFRRVRHAALEAGYPEQAMWAAIWEIELRYALGNTDGVRDIPRIATQLAENLGAVNEVLAAICQCDARACDSDWNALSELATVQLHRLRKQGAGRNREPRLLALIGTAQLELGNLERGRDAARQCVAFIRESHSGINPHGYAVLARAQLALHESAADIAGALAEYESVLTHSGFRVYAGELHELRACLAEREGPTRERAAALALAHTGYTRFGRATQAARIDALRE